MDQDLKIWLAEQFNHLMKFSGLEPFAVSPLLISSGKLLKMFFNQIEEIKKTFVLNFDIFDSNKCFCDLNNLSELFSLVEPSLPISHIKFDTNDILFISEEEIENYDSASSIKDSEMSNSSYFKFCSNNQSNVDSDCVQFDEIFDSFNQIFNFKHSCEFCHQFDFKSCCKHQNTYQPNHNKDSIYKQTSSILIEESGDISNIHCLILLIIKNGLFDFEILMRLLGNIKLRLILDFYKQNQMFFEVQNESECEELFHNGEQNNLHNFIGDFKIKFLSFKDNLLQIFLEDFINENLYTSNNFTNFKILKFNKNYQSESLSSSEFILPIEHSNYKNNLYLFLFKTSNDYYPSLTELLKNSLQAINHKFKCSTNEPIKNLQFKKFQSIFFESKYENKNSKFN